jgi:collagen type III alpha
MDTGPADERLEDALLGGRLGPDEVPPAWRPLAELVHASRAPFLPGELAAEDQTVAALLHSAHRGGRGSRRRSRTRTGMLARALSLKTTVIIMAVLGGGGVATAATGAMAPVRAIIISGLAKVGLAPSPSNQSVHHPTDVGKAPRPDAHKSIDSGNEPGNACVDPAGSSTSTTVACTTPSTSVTDSTSTFSDAGSTSSGVGAGPGVASTPQSTVSDTATTKPGNAGSQGVGGTKGNGNGNSQSNGNGNSQSNGNGNGNGNGQGNGSSQGNSGGQGQGNGNSQGNGNKNGQGNGQSQGNVSGPGNSNKNSHAISSAAA